ncbi:MAG: hypothetical protein ACE145_18210 [Terriglobia bacterium]
MRFLMAMLAAAMLVTVGCSKTVSEDPKPAIQAAVEAYLKQQQNLMLANMTLEVKDVKVTGDKAEAEVQFRSKQGAGPTVAVRYALKRAGSGWQVESRLSTGGMGGSPHGGAETAPPAPSATPGESELKSSH